MCRGLLVWIRQLPLAYPSRVAIFARSDSTIFYLWKAQGRTYYAVNGGADRKALRTLVASSARLRWRRANRRESGPRWIRGLPVKRVLSLSVGLLSLRAPTPPAQRHPRGTPERRR